MNKLIRHIRLHVAAYFVPLIFAFLLTAGGVGVFVSKIPADDIKFGVLKALVVFAQSMSMDDPAQKKKNPHKNKRVDELIKLETRKRKNANKDTHEDYAWDWRMLEEGELHVPNYGRYFIVPDKMVWLYTAEPTGQAIQWSTSFYMKSQLHHWILYFAVLIGMGSFFNGFFLEITKAGY